MLKILSLSTLLTCCFVFMACEAQDKQDERALDTTEIVLNTEERLGNIKGDLNIVKAELTKEGNYNCCIQPGCDWCVLHEGECACHDNITAGKEVCPGCGLGWHNGKGVVQGVDAKKVKWNIAHEHAEGGHKH